MSFQDFADLFDPVIDKRHAGYPKDAKHPTDLDASKVILKFWSIIPDT